MRVKLLFLLMLIAPRVVVASVASTGYVTDYVKQQSETKVDTSASANQTMAGSYTVSGSFKVPTPPLPSPE